MIQITKDILCDSVEHYMVKAAADMAARYAATVRLTSSPQGLEYQRATISFEGETDVLQYTADVLTASRLGRASRHQRLNEIKRRHELGDTIYLAAPCDYFVGGVRKNRATI